MVPWPLGQGQGTTASREWKGIIFLPPRPALTQGRTWVEVEFSHSRSKILLLLYWPCTGKKRVVPIQLSRCGFPLQWDLSANCGWAGHFWTHSNDTSGGPLLSTPIDWIFSCKKRNFALNPVFWENWSWVAAKGKFFNRGIFGGLNGQISIFDPLEV